MNWPRILITGAAGFIGGWTAEELCRAGATNVSFEGIRCDSKKVRVYAFGHPNSQWSRARDPEWREIKARDINGYHYALRQDYFCWTSSRTATYPLKQIIANFKTPSRLMPAD